MKVVSLDHVALPVLNLDTSISFYAEVLKLHRMDRPAFAFPGAWFILGTDRELHLIARGKHSSLRTKDRHFALQVADIEEAATHLRILNVDFQGPKQRPDGFWQIFVADPDGHFVELCCPAKP